MDKTYFVWGWSNSLSEHNLTQIFNWRAAIFMVDCAKIKTERELITIRHGLKWDFFITQIMNFLFIVF